MSDSSTEAPMPVAPDDTATVLTDIVATTLLSAGAETTVASSTLTDSATSSRIDAQNVLPTQPTNSAPAVTSGESARPASSTVDPISVVGSPNTVTPAINTGSTAVVDSQTRPNAVTAVDVADNPQRPQTPPTVAADGAGAGEPTAGVSNANATGNLKNIIPNATDAGGASSIAVPNATELSTTTSASNLSTAAPSTEVSMTTNTIVSDVSLADEFATSDLPISAAPTIPNNGNAANSINGTMIDNSIISQASTEISVPADTPTGSIPGMTAVSDLTATPVINADSDAMLVSSAVGSADNSAIASSAMSNRTVANSMTNDETVIAAPIDENVVSISRRKEAAIKSESNVKNITNGDTVKNGPMDGSPGPRRRRSPRGYFSSYPGTIGYRTFSPRINIHLLQMKL